MRYRTYPVLSLRGTAYERGHQHGRVAKQRVENSLAIYQKAFERQGLKWARVLELAQEYIPIIGQFDSEMLEEVEGIAAGAERVLTEIVALNVDKGGLLLRTGGVAPECTAVAVISEATSSKHTLIGQNADWIPGLTDSAVILKIKQDGKPDILTYCEAGMISFVGFNSAGIGTVGNLLISEGTEGRLGVTHPFIRRRILNAETMSEAVGAILQAQRASSSNYMLAHRDGVAIDLEATPDDVFNIYPAGGILVHANHFTVAGSNVRDAGKARFPDTLLRDWRVRSLLEPKRGRIDISDVKEALRDHFSYPYSVCRHRITPQGGKNDCLETIISIIMDLNEETMYFTEGPPCANEYNALALEWGK